MATAKPDTRRRRMLQWVAVGVVVVTAVVALLLGQRIGSYATAAAAVGARQACSCRYIGGRELGDCRKDFEPGMGLVVLSEDSAARSVTARVPLLSRQTATYRVGEGCTLERWAD